MATILYVSAGDEETQSSCVACWDPDPAHALVNPVWAEAGGAYIVGIPDQPDAVYLVADTLGVRLAIQQGRLRLIETVAERVEPPAPSDDYPVDAPSESASKKRR